MLRRNCRDGHLNLRCGLRLRRGFRLSNRRTLQEVLAKRSFQIGYKLAHRLGLRNAETRWRRVSDRLKFFLGFGLNVMHRGKGLHRSVLARRFRFM